MLDISGDICFFMTLEVQLNYQNILDMKEKQSI